MRALRWPDGLVTDIHAAGSPGPQEGATVIEIDEVESAEPGLPLRLDPANPRRAIVDPVRASRERRKREVRMRAEQLNLKAKLQTMKGGADSETRDAIDELLKEIG